MGIMRRVVNRFHKACEAYDQYLPLQALALAYEYQLWFNLARLVTGKCYLCHNYEFNLHLTHDLDDYGRKRDFHLKGSKSFQITLDFYVTHIYVVSLIGALKLYF